MPIFNDAKPPVYFIPESDAIFCAVEKELKWSQGSKTRGAFQVEMRLEVEGRNTWFYETLTVHPSTMWRVDAFLKCVGMAPPVGKGWTFDNEELAQNPDWEFIDVLGARGYCHLIVDEYPLGSGRKKNKASVFYVDRPKLERRTIIVPREQPGQEDVPF